MWLMEGVVGGWRNLWLTYRAVTVLFSKGVKLDWEAGKSRLRNRTRGLDVSVCLACERFGGMVWNGSSKLRGRDLKFPELQPLQHFALSTA
jgi:hypothetical protein